VSIKIAVGSAFLSVGGATLAAYALVYGQFPGLKFLRGSVFIARMMPPAALILPIFLLLRTFGLSDTVLGLVFAHTAWNLPFGIWLMLPFFRAVPEEIFQAAQMDGCHYGQIFRWILLPLVVPGMVVTFLFCFLMSWNDFLFGLILGGSQTKTAALMVNGYVAADQISWGPMAASACLIMVPAFGLAWFLQKHLVEGLSAGSVKG
jgi:multiple sugar transport system permease protein